MARDYDSQLLESVAVRRKRLREAVLFGPQRTRRRLDENIAKIIAGLAVSAVVCAGSVGWSFLQSQLNSEEDAAQAEQEATSAPQPAPSAPVPADWVGGEVTMDMLAAELNSAGVPADLYTLPDEPRPPDGTATSYYLLTESEQGYTAGIIEYDQGRTGAEFSTEDEAARWLYSELVLADAEPQPLGSGAEAKAQRRTDDVVQQVEKAIGGGGDSTQQTLKRGTVVDAFGQESGSLLFPDGQPFAERGLPDLARGAEGAETSPDTEGEAADYHRYRVTHPLTVDASLSPGAGDNPGGGVRFTIEADGFVQPPELPSIRWLLANGYLERVEAGEAPA